MAGSLIGGLIDAGFMASDITVAEPDETRRQILGESYDISTCADNDDTRECDIIILAVKPQLLKTVCQQLTVNDSDSNAGSTLFISIAAGVKSTDIERWLNKNDDSGEMKSNAHANSPANTLANKRANKRAIVRCMPNTPSLLQCGASGLYANSSVTDVQKQQAEKILQAVGIVLWVENEELLNAVTAVSGSGPAYFFLMMEAMQNAGETLGLPADVSRQLVSQSALGAARMAVESTSSPAELRQSVTSKGGTTEQAILSLQTANYQQIISDALKAANDRSISLADELGSE